MNCVQGRGSPKKYSSAKNDNLQSIIEYLPQNISRKPRSFLVEGLAGFPADKKKRSSTSQIMTQVMDINAQSVHLNSKSMNYKDNSITNYRKELEIEKENHKTRESDMMEFESDFFRDVPEEDELPLNFEIPGPIPDLVDLYAFGI
ncbi:hypothetical protein D8674_011360 [Pyrus ussuriensis x Pyrus communis]|uniref:Uncharacterized protein n=1 Tax=Pyrus ussuriensis x Pyrus communis TaxID=2448454 RepID=A0A5N5G439_9ROSA|nr:hypothetical protein D8674_011360 [Pyrus ussuriensis x Pyrus communis]